MTFQRIILPGCFLLIMITASAQTPKPTIIIRDALHGKEIDVKNGLRGNGPFTFKVAAEEGSNPDGPPKDNPYKIQNMEVILVRGTQRVATLAVTNELVDLSPWAASMKPGDRIIISVHNVVKILPDKKKEKVDMSGTIINIPIS